MVYRYSTSRSCLSSVFISISVLLRNDYRKRQRASSAVSRFLRVDKVVSCSLKLELNVEIKWWNGSSPHRSGDGHVPRAWRFCILMQWTDDRRVSSEAASGCGRLISRELPKSMLAWGIPIPGLLSLSDLPSGYYTCHRVPKWSLKCIAFLHHLLRIALLYRYGSVHLPRIARGSAAEFATPRLVRMGS